MSGAAAYSKAKYAAFSSLLAVGGLLALSLTASAGGAIELPDSFGVGNCDGSGGPIGGILGNNSCPLESDESGGAGTGGGAIGLIPGAVFTIPSITEKTFAAMGIAAIIGLGASIFVGRIYYADPDKILSNGERKTIFSLIRSKPGIYLKQICVNVSANPTGALWHLRKLERAGLIKTEKINGRRTYRPLICDNGRSGRSAMPSM